MTMVTKYTRALLTAAALLVLPGLQAAQPPAQEGFVPVEQQSGQESMPAAPLVAAAYGVAWAAVLVYLFSVWQRLGTVERELTEVARRIDSRGRR